MKKLTLVLLTILLLSGCDEEAPKAPEKTVYQNSFNQFYEEVPIDDWEAWLDNHKTCKIITLTSVARIYGDCNRTDHIMVFYETQTNRPQ